MHSDSSKLHDFIKLSEELTDFSDFQLQGTGVAELYLETVTNIVGSETIDELLSTFIQDVQDKAGEDRKLLDKYLRAKILSDDKFGPVTRNIIKLWFIGTWYQLPLDWQERFGIRSQDKTFIPSSAAYVEGLLWPTIGAHPPGAKAPGYGTWDKAPDIPSSRSSAS